MAGIPVRLRLGPDTYQVSATVTGGQLVVPTTNGRVGPAGANALTVMGVALNDAKPAGSDVNTDFSTVRPDVAVAYAPAEVSVTYAASAVFGDRLVAAASGQVTPVAVVTTPTAADVNSTRGIVGICTEPAGVAPAGVGRMRLV